MSEKHSTVDWHEQYAASVRARIEAKTERSSGCWIWTGAAYTPVKRYPDRKVGMVALSRFWTGKLCTANNAHIAAYLAYVGPIAAGLWVRQTCGNLLCCNPEHLQLLKPTNILTLRRPRESVSRQDYGTSGVAS